MRGVLALDPDRVRIFGEVFIRNAIVGTGLFFLAEEANGAVLGLNVAAYLLLVVWSYYDGFLSSGRWHVAFLEAGGCFLIAGKIAQLLLMAFGSPVDTAADPLVAG